MEEDDRMKWEYLALPVVDIEVANRIKLMRHLSDSTAVHYPTINELGAEGWELVSVDDETAYFKRPLEETPPAIVVIYTDKAQQAQEIADEINRHLRMRGDD